jgi:hypothetical protein
MRSYETRKRLPDPDDAARSAHAGGRRRMPGVGRCVGVSPIGVIKGWWPRRGRFTIQEVICSIPSAGYGGVAT